MTVRQPRNRFDIFILIIIFLQIKFDIFIINQMDLKVIEPIKNYLKEFKTVDEFNLWYSKNKDEVDKLTTHKLNKMYKIDGYRITKIKGVLMLKKWEGIDEKSTGISSNKELESDLKTAELENFVRSKTLRLESEIKEIKETVNKIITFIQETTSSSSIDVSPPSTTFTNI